MLMDLLPRELQDLVYEYSVSISHGRVLHELQLYREDYSWHNYWIFNANYGLHRQPFSAYYFHNYSGIPIGSLARTQQLGVYNYGLAYRLYRNYYY